MALTLADQATLVANVAWQKRVAAAVAETAQSTISKLGSTVPNAYALKQLAAQAITDQTLTEGFCRFVAAGFAAGVSSLATPVEATGTDAQLKTQVRDAFDAFVAR